ncbi:hypothetical protein M0805_001435 [Coniferiporia weirii]|nr:hypothetical protein M0805_001435 [Coniferiporia weirii]
MSTTWSTWSRFFTRESKRIRLDTLPEEILVDEIFQWLSVRDIVMVRRVNKALMALTKKPVIWKRFLPYLANMRQPLAPLPPTKQYSLKNMTSHDMETIVTRAISYEWTWKSRVLRPWGWFGGLAYHYIEEMTFLPGGHFLVTSVRTFDGMYGIIIWVLEHPATQKPAPLLFRYTEVKAYGLQTKYMTVGGAKGICVAFLRKWHKVREDTRHIPETFEMGGKEDEEDPYMPLKYECTTLFVSLDIIEWLTDRHLKPMTRKFEKRTQQIARGLEGGDMWHVVSRIRTGTQLGMISLDVIDGDAHVCVVKRHNTIVLEKLNSKERTILHCRTTHDHPGVHHSIWNFRVLANQNHILVVRSTGIPDPNTRARSLDIELYEIPATGQTLSVHHYARLPLRKPNFLNVQISDVQRYMPFEGDESISSGLMKERPPPPLSLFLRTETGFQHLSFWPKNIALPPSPPLTPAQSSPRRNMAKMPYGHYIYDLADFKNTVFKATKIRATKPMEDEDSEGEKENGPVETVHDHMRFLPGSRRAVVYEIPGEYRSTAPPINICYGFQDLSREQVTPLQSAQAEEAEVENALLGNGGHPPPSSDTPVVHPSLDIPLRPPTRGSSLAHMDLPPAVEKQLEAGVTAICFDEETGRLAFATKGDRRLHVTDFSFTRSRDDMDDELTKMMEEAIKMEGQWLTS